MQGDEESVKALVYTKSDAEFSQIRDALNDVSRLIDVSRDPLDSHGHYSDPYDVIFIALDGARGMNEVNEWTGRFPSSRVIWITDDKEFAGIAIQKHIFDFIVRPFDNSRLCESLRQMLTDRSVVNS